MVLARPSKFTTLTALASVLFMLCVQGCPAKRAPGVRFPITSGFHSVLPSTEQRILIWGDPPVADVAMEWLRTHHYSHLMVPGKSPLQAPQIAHTLSTRNAALAVAREMKT